MIRIILRGLIEMAKLIIKKTGGAPANVSDLTAVPGDVAEGDVFYGTGSEKTQAGTVKKRGVVRKTIGVNGSVTLEPGIYDSGGYVSQNITVQDGFSIDPTAAGVSANVLGKYLRDNIIVKGVPNLLPENIRKGAFIGTVAGTWEGYVNNSPLTPYWYGLFAPGQTGESIYNRSPNSGVVGDDSIDWQYGSAKPDGQYIYMRSSPTSKNPVYPAFRFNIPIEMQGVKSVSIMYSLPYHSANQYTWLILAEKSVYNITGSTSWALSESRLGAYESHVLPGTTESNIVWSVQTFNINQANTSKYKYVYVGIGVGASSDQGRFIEVKYIKLNK